MGRTIGSLSKMFLLILSSLAMSPSCAAPTQTLKDTWDEMLPSSILTPICSSGRCWGLLPTPQDGDAEYIFSQDFLPQRLQIRQADYDEAALRPWKGEETTGLTSEARAVKQTPSRIAKKDVFISRSWGGGGMPFSVLYMTPHAPRLNHPSNAQQESGKTLEPPRGKTQEITVSPLSSHTSSTTHTNNRVTLRTGAPRQPRRQYSIIPQLFISYGWGPLGK